MIFMGSITPESYSMMLLRLEGNKRREAVLNGEPEPLESELQDKIRQDVESRGWWVLWSRMDCATTTPKGTPDLIIFADRARVFIVEAKARNEKLRPAQLGVKLKLESLGHKVSVVRNMQEYHEAINHHDNATNDGVQAMRPIRD